MAEELDLAITLQIRTVIPNVARDQVGALIEEKVKFIQEEIIHLFPEGAEFFRYNFSLHEPGVIPLAGDDES